VFRSVLSRVAGVAGLLVLALTAGCGQPAAPLTIFIAPATGHAVIRVGGLSSGELSSLQRATFTQAQWLALMRVTVDGPPDSNPPVAGTYRVSGGSLDFTPTFPFDPGRGYAVTFDPAALPSPRDAPAFRTVVVMPPDAYVPNVTITRMLPSSDVLPENLLRIYLEFSAPMSRAHGREFIRLEDERGQEVRDAFLALDVDFWSPDGRRYTVFLDPGRVKRGILPNDQVGRALKTGHRFVLVVDPAWRDAHGQPMAAGFRHAFSVGPAEMHPIAPADWTIASPPANTRRALVVRFPRPLDHGLLQRAIGVERDGQIIDGDIAIDAEETAWHFTPKAPWRAGPHVLVVLSILEDPMGNKIGRPFDIDNFTNIDKSPTPDRVTRPFIVK